MSAAILQFRSRPKPTPSAPMPEITDAECNLLDRVKAEADRALDVVNAGKPLIRSFLAHEKNIVVKFNHLGVDYELTVSLDRPAEGPRFA